MTGLLQSDELTAVRETVALVLPDTCNILSPTRTGDNQGGWTDSWGTAGTAIACRLDGNLGGQRENVSGGGLRAHAAFILTVPYDTTIQSGWRVEHSGNTYAVIGSPRKSTSWSAHVRCELELV